MSRAGVPWHCTLKPIHVELVGAGTVRASCDWSGGVFVWHTFGDSGFDGESGQCGTMDDAKRAAIASIVVQGWAPGGWRIAW